MCGGCDGGWKSCLTITEEVFRDLIKPTSLFVQPIKLHYSLYRRRRGSIKMMHISIYDTREMFFEIKNVRTAFLFADLNFPALLAR